MNFLIRSQRKLEKFHVGVSGSHEGRKKEENLVRFIFQYQRHGVSINNLILPRKNYFIEKKKKKRWKDNSPAVI